MQEFINQLFGDFRSALRFRWHGMVVAWIVCLGGWGVVSSMPDVYEGSARFYVDTSSVLAPVLGNQIVAQDVDAQIAYVREALLGRTQLETVIEKVGLRTEVASNEEWEALLAGLRRRIVIESARPDRSNPDSVYTISYRNSDREKAVGVVRSLLEEFTEGTRGASQRGGDTAEQFLDARVAEYEERLQRAERALADFKKQNADRLPGAEGDYFQRMQVERDRLDTARRELRILEAKRDQLREQLNSQSMVVAGVNPVDDLPPNSIDARIRDYQAQLDAALLEFTEKHPDVIALREGLQTLTAQRDSQLRALGIEDTDQELTRLGANPVHQAVQIALNQAEVDIATLRTDVAERQANMFNLQALIDEVPEVEAELARLNRDYEVIYEQYLEIVRSRETQQLTRKASDADQIEFRMIDPPLASIFPVAPPRLLLLAGVFLGSIGLGAGLAHVGALLWPVFGNMRTLSAVTELPVLGFVSEAWNERRQAETRQGVRSFMSALGLLTLVFVCAVLIEIAGPGLFNLLGGAS